MQLILMDQETLNLLSEIVNPCPHCRTDNYASAEKCRECGAELGNAKKSVLTEPPNQNTSQSKNESISGPTKLGYWFAAWGCVVLIVLVSMPAYILAAPFFPLGLFALMPQGEEGGIEAMMTGGFIIGWAIYMLLSVIMFKTKNRGLFFFIYVMFCALLLLNLAGCYRTTEAASHIQ
jgi:hypothetical protein